MRKDPRFRKKQKSHHHALLLDRSPRSRLLQARRAGGLPGRWRLRRRPRYHKQGPGPPSSSTRRVCRRAHARGHRRGAGPRRSRARRAKFHARRAAPAGVVAAQAHLHGLAMQRSAAAAQVPELPRELVVAIARCFDRIAAHAHREGLPLRDLRQELQLPPVPRLLRVLLPALARALLPAPILPPVRVRAPADCGHMPCCFVFSL